MALIKLVTFACLMRTIAARPASKTLPYALPTNRPVINTLFEASLPSLSTWILHAVETLPRDFLLHGNSAKAFSWHLFTLPGYANKTDISWLLNLRGCVQQRVMIDDESATELVNDLLYSADVANPYHTKAKHGKRWFGADKITGHEAEIALARIREITTIGQPGVQIAFAPRGHDNDSVTLPQLTNVDGEFSVRLPLRNNRDPKSPSSVHSSSVQPLELFVQQLNVGDEWPPKDDTSEQFATNYLVPPTGVTFASDIDDTIRNTEIWNVKQLLLNVFVRDYKPWLNMPSIFRLWQQKVPSAHFHYITDAPKLLARSIVEGTLDHYPPGSFDFRLSKYKDVDGSANPRYHHLLQLIESFPKRKFVFLGDSGSPSVFKAFAKLMKEHPDAVQCLLIRDIASTEPAEWRKPPLYHFLDLPTNKYFIFQRPSDLHNISTAHLNNLMNGNTTGCFPAPNKDADFDILTPRPPNSRDPEMSDKWYIATSAYNLVKWELKCFRWLWWLKREKHACPFDRRPGTKYNAGSQKGKIEPEHDRASAVHDVWPTMFPEWSLK